MPILQYMICGNLQYSYLMTKEVPAHIEKLKGIGAKCFAVYEMPCGCRAGYRYDDQGIDTPCDRCEVGRETYRYENGFSPDPVF